MAGGLSLPPPPGVLTGDDIVRAGACGAGVARRLAALAGQITAAEPVSRLLTLVPEEERQHVLDAALDQNLRSCGATLSYGYGYGDGRGSGRSYG